MPSVTAYVGGEGVLAKATMVLVLRSSQSQGVFETGPILFC